MAEPVGNQILDGANLQTVMLGKRYQIIQPCHGAIIIHNFADDGGRIEPGEACQIDGRFGVAGADQDAAFTGDEREDMAGRDDVVGTLCRIDGGCNCAGAIVGGNTCRNTFAGLNRLGEGGAVVRLIRAHHVFEPQFSCPCR